MVSPFGYSGRFRERREAIDMVSFSSDTDILKCEPALFSELYPAEQVLISGSGGTLSGTSFTAAGADFVSAVVSAGGVVHLQSPDGSLDGAYEIVSVDSVTQLTVSVIRADAEGQAIAPPAATDVSFRVCTYGPQANEIGFRLTEYFGIQPGNPQSDIGSDDILDSEVLRQASVFGVICSVYAMLASNAEDENFWKKSLYYRRLFEKARQRCRLAIDTGSDGVCDVTRFGGAVKLRRG